MRSGTDEPRPGWRRTKRWLVHLLVLAFLYQLASGLLVTTRARLPRWGAELSGPLPNLRILERFFSMFVVFDRYSPTNVEITARGLARSDSGAPVQELLDLRLERYFPQPRGDAYRRVTFWTYPAPRRRELLIELCDRIQRLHNERHPDRPVERVYLYQHTWPKSPEGFYALHDERESRVLANN